MGTRENILAALAVRLATASDIVTVKRSLMSEVELRRYTRSQLPMVVVVEPDEPLPQYTPGQHAVVHLNVAVLLIYEQWAYDSTGPTQVNGLRDQVIEKIYADLTNGGNSHNIDIANSATVIKTFPIFVDRLDLVVDFYQSYLVR